ncbi:MAG: amidase [Actinomycetota bacterium]
MAQLPDMSLVEASHAIKRGTLSPTDLIEACLARAAVAEPAIKAFAALDADQARRDAAALTDELRRQGARGPLHGIPIGVKDVIDVDGLPTRAGSHVLDNEPIPADAPVIRRLREAGAVILGKCTTHEFACGVTTPPTRNPWNPDHVPGGSSGGSGAALAAGECLASIGTDSGGSVRVPAAFNGVVGLRPRRETVPMEGIVPFSWTHDTVGPLGRSADDVAIVWRVMSEDRSATTELPLAHVRMGVFDPLRKVLEVEPDVEIAYEAAVDVLGRAGANTRNVRITPLAEWGEARAKVVVCDMLAAHRDAGWFPQRSDAYSDQALAFLRSGEAITGADLTLARRRLQGLGEELLALYDEVDALLWPTAILTAPSVAEAVAKSEPGKPPPLVPETMRATGPVGWCGLAGLSVPMGRASNGLPMGLQIVTEDESVALSVGAAFQKVTDHHSARPPIERFVATS